MPASPRPSPEPEHVTWSRRSALRWVAALPLSAAMVAGTTSQALAKAKQKAVRYQAEPKGDHSCANCRHFQPPNACKLVEGEISPNGWCMVWSKMQS